MILVTNITKGEQFEADAIETLTLKDGEYYPTERDKADGFDAMTIVHVSPTEEYYTHEYFAFEGHTLKGTEDTGEYEFIPDDEQNN